MEIKNKLIFLFSTVISVMALVSCSPSQKAMTEYFFEKGGLFLPTNTIVNLATNDFLPDAPSFASIITFNETSLPQFISSNNLIKIENTNYSYFYSRFPFATKPLIGTNPASHWVISSDRVISGYVILIPGQSNEYVACIRFVLPKHAK
jgi:hypothetical protein